MNYVFRELSLRQRGSSNITRYGPLYNAMKYEQPWARGIVLNSRIADMRTLVDDFESSVPTNVVAVPLRT